MSSIAISGNTSGTGEFSLEAPETTADHNITLADASGNVVISDGTTITADYTNNRFSFGGTVVFNGLATNFNKWEILNANTSLVANKNYFANTQTTLTLTLPATANIGDTIRVFDNEGHASANVVTISRNGNKIDGFDRNVVITTNRDGVELVYVGPEVGFVTREQKTEGRFFGTQAQGESFGYNSGGVIAPGPTVNTIDKYPFSSDTNASDVGDISTAESGRGGQSSISHGYSSSATDIDKFPFAVDTNAIDIGNLTVTRGNVGAQSSKVSGYVSGGSPSSNVIDKFPFAVDTNASDVGDLTQGRSQNGGTSSLEFGYNAGGSPPVRNTIDKFPFAVDTNASDVGDLSAAKRQAAGTNSKEFGYASGGQDASTPLNVIERFPFASDSNATDLADLTQSRRFPGGQSSTTHGYNSGGYSTSAPTGHFDTIDKFPFASEANASDVGNLTQARSNLAGHQV